MTRPVRLTITRVAVDGEVLVVDAETRVDRVAFGITATRRPAARYLLVSLHARIVRG